MKKTILYLCLAFCVVVLTASRMVGQQDKLAQTGMKFLSLSTDARGGALGDAMTSLEANSSAMFFNTATMARMKSTVDVAVNRTNWIAGIHYLSASAAFAPFDGTYGIIGVFFTTVDYGNDFYGTILSENEQGFEETGPLSPSAYAVGVGYARALTDKFFIGGNVKLVGQNLGTSVVDVAEDGSLLKKDYKKSVLAFDFGLLYRTGYKSLVFGMCLRNFSEEVKYEIESFQLPLTFKVGISMNVFDLTKLDPETHSLFLAVDAVQPRDYKQQLSIGMEYGLMQKFFLRAGVLFPNDNYAFNAGLGFRQEIGGTVIGVDYAYTPFQKFDSVHRFSIHFGM